MNWWVKYLGRDYVDKVYECTDFVADVRRERFNHVLPAWRPPVSVRACDRAGPKIAAQVLGALTDRPIDGDCVLMRSSAGRRLRGWHCGIYVDAGEPAVLHCLTGCGSVLTLMRDLDRLNLTVDGVYKWTI